MLLRTEGIVLRNTLFGEADLIVTFLTLDLGIIKAFAKSPRKIKSRFGSSLEPFTYSEVSFWGKDASNLPKLTQADIIKPFQGIREKIECLMKASEIVELTVRFIPERELNKEVFFLLKETLNAIEEAQPVHAARNASVLDLIVLFYKVHLLRLAGYAPRLEMSSMSAVKFTKNHASRAPLTENISAIMKLYESLSKWSASKLNRIRPSSELIIGLTNILDTHISHTLSN